MQGTNTSFFHTVFRRRTDHAFAPGAELFLADHPPVSPGHFIFEGENDGWISNFAG